MTILEVLQQAVNSDASDIFLVAGVPVTFKCKGQQRRLEGDNLMPDTIEALVEQIYETSRRDRKNFDSRSDDDFSFAISGLGRFRVNVYRQRGSVAAVSGCSPFIRFSVFASLSA